MKESRVGRHLDQLTDQLGSMTTTVVGVPGIAPPDVRTVLRFVNKVVQVVDHAFQDVYAILIDVQFLQEGELSTGRIIELRRSLALLRSRSRYRDAEEICSRLHHLSEEYSQTIEPIVAGVADRQAWSGMFSLLDKYEGNIIEMVEDSVHDLQKMLARLDSHSGNLHQVTEEACKLAIEIRSSLVKLTEIRNRILGLSGTPGLMALVSSSDSEYAASLIAQEVRMGNTYHVHGMRDQYNVNQAGAVGPMSTAENISFTQAWADSAVNLLALKEELGRLRTAMRKEANEPSHDLAVAEIASAELAANTGDGPRALEHLAKAGRWALDIAVAIGAALAAEMIKNAAGI